MVILRNTSTVVRNDYQYLVLRSPIIASQIERLSFGSAQPQLTLKGITTLKIPLPPTKAEQEAIAEALSDADAHIEALEQLISKKNHLKQGAMQELLTGRRRLPGFTEEWNTWPLGRIAPLQRGFDLPNSKLQQGPYPVVYSNGALNHHAVFQVKGPGVVTGRSGTIGTVTFVERDFWPHNTSLWVTTFKENDPKFVFYLYKSIGLDRFATGSGVPTLNRNDVHAFEASVPASKNEQTAITSILSDMDAEIAALEAKLTKARQLKLGMMQELVTGKTRLI
jgi:type I restriction enzyme S subunit